jgi:hypothetical protein
MPKILTHPLWALCPQGRLKGWVWINRVRKVKKVLQRYSAKLSDTTKLVPDVGDDVIKPQGR